MSFFRNRKKLKPMYRDEDDFVRGQKIKIALAVLFAVIALVAGHGRLR